MKHAVTLVAAAGLASVLALPANAQSGQSNNGLRSKTTVEHTDISSRRYGYRGYRPYGGPRYGYYRPYYGGYSPYYYGPGVSLGFAGGPRFGVWF